MGIKDRLKNEKGLTLIEVLASVAILLIVLGIGMAALMQSSVLTSKVQGESQDRQDMQVGLLELTNVVQSATDIKKGKDNYNFEIIDSENRTIKYWLVDGQLNSDSKDGQTQVEGIEKMTIDEHKGITLEIENLEEPVVLATRGGGTIFATDLTDENDKFKEIVCVRKDQVDGIRIKREKDFSGYNQLETIAFTPHKWSGDSIECDTNSGTLFIKNGVKVNLSDGSLRIITNTLKIDQNASFSISNGSLSLPKSLPVKNPSLSPKSDVEVYHNAIVNSGGYLEVGGDFRSTGNSVTVTSEKDMRFSGKVIGNLKSTLTSKANIYIDGALTTLNNELAVKSEKNIVVNSNVVLDFKSTMTSSDGSIYINGTVTNKNNETVIKSGANLFISGALDNKFKSKINTEGWVFIKGDLKNPSNQPEIRSGGDITVLGNITNAQEAKLISDKSIYISGDLNSDQKFEFHAKDNMVVKGSIINAQNGTISLTKGSLYIGGKLHMDRLNIVNIANSLYVQEGLHMVETTKLKVNIDSFINGKIQLPTNPYHTDGAYFHTTNFLTYTGPIDGVQINSSNFKVLNYKDYKQVSSLDTLPTFPSFPETPVFPSQLFK